MTRTDTDTGDARIVLRAEVLYWLGDTPDQQTHDQCGHGNVRLAIDGTVFARTPADADGTNVTGAGLFLLRTLSHSHAAPDWLVTAGDDTNQLFPCCANPFGTSAGSDHPFTVFVSGCPNGVNFEVIRKEGLVVIRDGNTASEVDAEEWRAAVVGFCTTVEAFYQASPPRVPSEDYDTTWAPFWLEWRDRITVAREGNSHRR